VPKTPGEVAEQIVSQGRPNFRLFKPILEALLQEFGSVEKMSGLIGLELGTVALLNLFEFLRDHGVLIEGVDRAGLPDSRFKEFLHKLTYGQYASHQPTESVDLCIQKFLFTQRILK